jgi:hypothetical protein
MPHILKIVEIQTFRLAFVVVGDSWGSLLAEMAGRQALPLAVFYARLGVVLSLPASPGAHALSDVWQMWCESFPPSRLLKKIDG